MKKIDTWLSIQRYVSEAAQAPLSNTTSTSNVELWGKARISGHGRRNRRFFVPRISTI